MDLSCADHQDISSTGSLYHIIYFQVSCFSSHLLTRLPLKLRDQEETQDFFLNLKHSFPRVSDTLFKIHKM